MDVTARPLATDSLTCAEEEIPPEFDWDWPDPDSGRPPELAGLSHEQIDALPAATPTRYREPAWPLDPPGPDATGPGSGPAFPVPLSGEIESWLRDGSGGGTGFADGGVLDTAPAGLALAGFTTGAQAQSGTLSDDAGRLAPVRDVLAAGWIDLLRG